MGVGRATAVHVPPVKPSGKPAKPNKVGVSMACATGGKPPNLCKVRE
jgi:hypothetical protein